ncbi:MAG: helix-turn-helix transcriptional regulator [Phascolarctobacterium sp.]|nr:helix-turn-helix transcriptional regulator [Phascolarctobacterium sp.]
MAKSFDQKLVGKRIKALRLQNNVYQTTLAKDIGVSQTHMSNIESGRAGLTIDNLVKMAEIFNCTLDAIIFGEDAKPNLVEHRAEVDQDTVNLEDCTIGEFMRALQMLRVMK